MRILLSTIAALGLTAAAAQAGDWHNSGAHPVHIHAYNFCPHGLQPVTLHGAVSCGRPNVHVHHHAPTRTYTESVSVSKTVTHTHTRSVTVGGHTHGHHGWHGH
ncbi:hypothetical protein [Pseudaestuariivita sp.]|uniref:hypothetical protein n=1 Tax=Pseudaestuariivita sp. TaxID=2211669 RepID=UPI00405A387A